MGPVSITGRILELHEQGYTQKQIALELRIQPGRVSAALNKLRSRSLDSQRIFEIRELLLEAVGILREMRSETQRRRDLQTARRAERELPQKLGAALDRLSSPGSPGTLP